MNYRKTPAERPRAKSLEAGDLLTDMQGRCIQDHTLSDYGLTLVKNRDGWKCITVREFRLVYA